MKEHSSFSCQHESKGEELPLPFPFFSARSLFATHPLCHLAWGLFSIQQPIALLKQAGSVLMGPESRL